MALMLLPYWAVSWIVILGSPVARNLGAGPDATLEAWVVAGIMVALSVTQLIPAGVRLVRDDILAAQTEASI